MKPVIIAFTLLVLTTQAAFAQKRGPQFITSDIDHFWQAYDRITTTTDSARQYAYLNQLFISKGTPGLRALMQVREYTSKSYIDAINHYPLFWSSIRANMFKAKSFAGEIARNVAQLQRLYPELRPASIYFTVGAFRTGGTTLDSMVLIGSEIAMADGQTNTQELAKTEPNLAAFFKTNPINNLVFTNVHEYVHTQQKTTAADNLLAQCVLEGVAEFMAEKATGMASTAPALSYGPQHEARIKQVFAQQLFNSSNGYWLYSNAPNEFGVRDLGYYVGHAICKQYYTRAVSKKQAIKEMIELDYNNATALARFVDQSGYFAQPVQTLHEAYDNSRPVVTGIAQLNNNIGVISPSVTQISITFSVAMDKRYRNFELGPLGQDALLKIKRFIGFSADGRTATFEVELQPGRRYQLTVGPGFRNTDGVSLRPYLIDFKTAAQ